MKACNMSARVANAPATLTIGQPRPAIGCVMVARSSSGDLHGSNAAGKRSVAANFVSNGNGNGTGASSAAVGYRPMIAEAVAHATMPLHAPDEVFLCPEESLFYSQCLEKLVMNRPSQPITLIEFGCGDGSPVISCLLKTPFNGTIYGYELNPAAARLAQARAMQFGLHTKYKVANNCFFKGAAERKSTVQCLVANPPYIAAPDDDILMPALHGGEDGANLTRDLMSLGFDSAMLLISAYCDPVKTIRHAQKEGYIVADFMVTPLPWGVYSSEPKVKNHLNMMKKQGRAFFSDHTYFLAGALFQKVSAGGGSSSDEDAMPPADLSDELLQVLTALK